ncbi:MAG: hypothetical protein HYR76_03780 [Ignavibacteria bacterium]|nr:hypothetical protein [Ignavibacteria bacterium]MBI3765847.1 hypothetical protein [Ignavibacteriales bacterium]
MDEELKQAELERIKAETEKLKAEKLKLDKESKPNWRKGIVAGSIAATVIGFYIDKAIVPSMQAENIRLNLENQKTLSANKNVLDSLQHARNEIATLTLSYSMKYADLVSGYKDLNGKYERLSESKNLTQKERDELKGTLAATQEKLHLLSVAQGEELAREWGRGRIQSFYFVGEFNPQNFRDSAKLYYSLPEDASITLLVCDAQRLMKRIYFIDERQHAGNHHIVWDARDNEGRVLPNGRYICRIKMGELDWQEREILKGE